MVKKKCDKHKIKFISQVSLVPNTGGYFIGMSGWVSSTIFNIYQSQDCLGIQKLSLF